MSAKNLENSAVATGLEKVSFIPIPNMGNAKECSNYHTIALISRASEIKPFKLGFSSTRTKKLQMYRRGLIKVEEPRSNCQLSLDHRENKGIPEKHLLLLH